MVDPVNFVFYRVLLHDSSSIVTLNVPEHFLLNVIQMALASDVRVSIPNIADVCHGDKSVSK